MLKKLFVIIGIVLLPFSSLADVSTISFTDMIGLGSDLAYLAVRSSTSIKDVKKFCMQQSQKLVPIKADYADYGRQIIYDVCLAGSKKQLNELGVYLFGKVKMLEYFCMEYKTDCDYYREFQPIYKIFTSIKRVK